jgi:fumarylacetoacetate (FAA) hydrolase family protein
MPIRQFASDSLYFRRNDEAIEEFAKLGFQLPENMARVLKVIDNRRTFRQVASHPSLVMDDTAGEAIRSLIKLGLIEAVPAKAEGDLSVEPSAITSTQRLRVISAAGDEISHTQALAAISTSAGALDELQKEAERRELAMIKAQLLDDLMPILGKDVNLIQAKIESAHNIEELMVAVGVCSRILEVSISKETSLKFVDAFKQRFAA